MVGFPVVISICAIPVTGIATLRINEKHNRMNNFIRLVYEVGAVGTTGLSKRPACF